VGEIQRERGGGEGVEEEKGRWRTLGCERQRERFVFKDGISEQMRGVGAREG
jgi:hypothetical protein